jgi:hypothetical protein
MASLELEVVNGHVQADLDLFRGFQRVLGHRDPVLAGIQTDLDVLPVLVGLDRHGLGAPIEVLDRDHSPFDNGAVGGDLALDLTALCERWSRATGQGEGQGINRGGPADGDARHKSSNGRPSARQPVIRQVYTGGRS